MEIHAEGDARDARPVEQQILAKHIGQSVERIKQDTDRDHFKEAPPPPPPPLDQVPEKRGEIAAPATPPAPKPSDLPSGRACCVLTNVKVVTHVIQTLIGQ